MDIENYKKLRNRAKDISTFIDNQPLRINVINYAARGKLKEIAHSMILSGLLCDNEILYSFLNNFMPSSINKREEPCKYEIKRECNHIDVSLENKSNFIIIENKVNDAIEQPNQIFQYVEEAQKKRKEVFVIYLNSVSRTLPTEKSLNGDNGISVFNLISKEHFVVLSYMYDILPWLDNLEKKLQKNLTSKPELRYLETSLFQYVDYLKMKFNTNDEFLEKMKEKIDILLSINPNISDEERINFYDKELSLLQKYTDEIEKVKKEIVYNLSKGWIETLQELWGSEIHFESHKNDDETGFVFVLNGKIKIVFSTNECKPWWGIHVENEILKKNITEQLKKCFCDIETKNPHWDVWRYTTFSDIMSEAKIIHDALEAIINEVAIQ